MKCSHQNRILGFTLSVFLVAMVCCDADNNIDHPGDNFFLKYYGGDGNQSAADFLPLSDGGFLLLGNSDFLSKRIFLVRTDAKGNVLWEKFISGPTDVARDIEPTLDGNFIILSDYDAGPGNKNIKLIRISPDGEKLDSVVYGTSVNDYSSSVTPISDGGFIVTGSTELNASNLGNPGSSGVNRSIFHFRCNADLVFNTFNWQELYGDPDTYDAGTKVVQNGTQFYVFGYSDQSHGTFSGKLNLLYYSIDDDGLNNNPNYLGDFDVDTRSVYAMEVPPSLGGGYFITATKTGQGGTTTLHVSKLRSPLNFNSIDDEQLDKEISVGSRILESASASASLSTPQGYLLLADEVRSLGEKNIWISKIDQSGNVLWSSSFGSESEDDMAAAIRELPDGKIVILGTMGIGNKQTKMALMKLNSQGQLLN